MVEQHFKMTEVGLIPEDWEVRKITDLTSTTSGGTPATTISNYWHGTIPWMSSGELNYIKVYETREYITELGLRNSSTKVIPAECVLIGLAGQGKTRGTVAINKIALCTNQSIAAFYPSKRINQEYLFFNLQRRYYELRSLSTGDGGRGGLNLFILNNLNIPYPPLPEQRAIATALSDADSWIESLEKLLAKKRLIKQGAMQRLLTPGEDWEVRKLGEVGKTYGGLTGKTKVDFANGKFSYIPFMNVMRNTVIDTTFFDSVNLKDKEYQNKVLENDLIFNGSSETPEELGLCAVLLEDIPDLYLNSFCFGFRLNSNKEFNPLFLSYFFRSSSGRLLIFYLAQGATRYNLSKTNFLNLEVPCPSIDEQTRIATILSDMDAEIERLEKKLQKAKQIKQGMMQLLLTGKVRLVGKEEMAAERV